MSAGLLCALALVYCAWGLVTSDPDGLAWARSRAGGMEVRHPVTWFVAPLEQSGKLELIDLVHRDQIVIVRAGRTDITSLDALRDQRWRELGEKASGRDTARRAVLRRLPPTAFPPGWVGFRRDITQAGGQRFVEVRAFGLMGPARRQEEWQALLFTRGRLERPLAVFRRILRSLRPSSP
jgi:hypothetical protein